MVTEKKIRAAQAVIVVAILLVIILVGVISPETETAEAERYASSKDLNGKPLCVVTGSIYDEYAMKHFPDSERVYVSDWADTAIMLTQGKVEGFLTEQADVTAMLDAYPELAVLPDVVDNLEYSFMMPHGSKGEALAEQFNAFLREYKQSGSFAALYEKWNDRQSKEPDMPPCTSSGANGVLRVATSNDWVPYCYNRDGETVGLFLDITYRFCEWAGYTPQVEVVPFTAAAAGIAAGKYDLFAYGCVISEERAEVAAFTDPLEGSDVFMMVRKSSTPGGGAYTDASQLDGKAFAALAGNIEELLVMEHFPNSEMMYFSSFPELLLSVAAGKTDACLVGETDVDSVVEAYPELQALPMDFSYPPCGYVTQKNAYGEALAAEFNEYLAEIKQSGAYDALLERWLAVQDGGDVMPEFVYSGEKGTLRIGLTITVYPYLFATEHGYSGYEAELIYGFCEWAGYTPEVEEAPLSTLVAGVQLGKYDIAATRISITKERAEQMTFTDPIEPEEPIMALVHKGDAATEASGAGFFSRFAKSFEKNFIRENRWKMMLSGLGVTLALALCAAVFGTLLGALICAMRRSANPYLTGFARLYVKLFQGMPIVVLLLLLYFVIFGKTGVSAFIVCAMGFSLDFSAYVSEIFHTGIEAVPKGQQRAALALGFGRLSAFQNVILPQAMQHILPVYRGQFVAMVKTTAVAGYISVQDLTKVSDIIRSRTYEAFFPLITAAVIYFLLAALLISALRLIEVRTDPLKRNREPKGVKLS